MGLARLSEVIRYLGELRTSTPEEPHWCPSMLGTDPTARGGGVGTRSLREGLARADADGVPVYLETTNPTNIGRDESYGFRLLRAVHVPSAPAAYRMPRPRRRLRNGGGRRAVRTEHGFR